MPSEQGGLDKEAKVGAMLRHMSGDVSAAFERTLKGLYSEEGVFTEVGAACAKWHWIIVKYAQDPSQMRGYISMIQFAFDNNINLEKLPSWKRLMRIILPEEFLRKMAGFTQVPQIAVMDETQISETSTSTTEASEVQW